MRRLFSFPVSLYTFSSIVFSTFLVIFISVSAARGIEFSDEGFYLNWISRPNDFHFSVTQFGFIYHPLFLAVQENIVALRIVNFLLTLSLSVTMFISLFAGKNFKGTFSGSVDSRICVTASLGFGCLVTLSCGIWILTPSYNTLNLQALLLVGIGIVRLYFSLSPSWLNHILIGVGGALCFMAKPSSAALLAIVVAGQLSLLNNRVKNFLMVFIAAVASVLTFIFLIDGSLAQFYSRIVDGLTVVQSLGTHKSLFRLDSFTVYSENVLFFVLLTLSVGVAQRFLSERMNYLLCAIISIVSLAMLFILVFGEIHISSNTYIGLLAWGPLFMSIVPVIFKSSNISLKDLVFGILCLCFAYVYAIGSNNNYWLLGSGATVFIALGSLFIIASSRRSQDMRSKILPLLASSQFICSLVLGVSVQTPYRQKEPLFSQSERISIRSANMTVAADSARYVEQLTMFFSKAGFQMNDPVIDMTGHYPGALFVLNAKPIGHPWIIGGYDGSDAFLREGLSRSKCSDLAKAWLLTEANGPRGLSFEVLDEYGLNLNRDYDPVGSFESVWEENPQTYTHVIYRPKNPGRVPVKNCKEDIRSRNVL